jgi:hypothetical protein
VEGLDWLSHKLRSYTKPTVTSGYSPSAAGVTTVS